MKTLRQIIKDKGVSQIQLSRALNLSESQMSLLLSGKRRMTLEIAKKIGDILGITMNEIFLSVDFAKRKVSK